MEQNNKTKIPMAVVFSDEDVAKKLEDTFDIIGEKSGEHRVTLYAREYRDNISLHLSSVKWQKALPSLSIHNKMGTEEKLEAVEAFRKKALERLSIESLPDLKDLFEKFSKK